MQNKSEFSIRERKQSVNNHKVDRKKMKQQERFNLKKNDPIKFQKIANSRRGGVSRWRD